MRPATLIIRTAGTNCDRELAHAFATAGAEPRTLHLNTLIAQPELIEQFDLIGLPGGFSYGDDIAAGRILANRLRHRLFEPLRTAIERSVPIIGICNGFQVLVKMGLLPDPARSARRETQIGSDAPAPDQTDTAPLQTVTLADNTSGRFIDRWVKLHVPDDTVCVWTRELAGRSFELPIAHGEGRFVCRTPDVLERLQRGRQVALRYGYADAAQPDNPNGSVDDIAGICDPSGLVLGLMPHPERYTHATAHPQWTRQDRDALAQTPVGLQLFQSAVEHVRARRGDAVLSRG